MDAGILPFPALYNIDRTSSLLFCGCNDQDDQEENCSCLKSVAGRSTLAIHLFDTGATKNFRTFLYVCCNALLHESTSISRTLTPMHSLVIAVARCSYSVADASAASIATDTAAAHGAVQTVRATAAAHGAVQTVRAIAASN